MCSAFSDGLVWAQRWWTTSSRFEILLFGRFAAIRVGPSQYTSTGSFMDVLNLASLTMRRGLSVKPLRLSHRPSNIGWLSCGQISCTALTAASLANRPSRLSFTLAPVLDLLSLKILLDRRLSLSETAPIEAIANEDGESCGQYQRQPRLLNGYDISSRPWLS